jgi:hypothetical protein
MRAAEFMRALADIIDKLDGEKTSDESPKNPEEKDPNPVMILPLQQGVNLDKIGKNNPKNPEEKDPNPVMVPPLQQAVELDKARIGKISPIIKKLTQDETEHNFNNPIFRR